MRRRLTSETERIGRPAHVVAAFDTELFGHWWYEGPVWLSVLGGPCPRPNWVGTRCDAKAAGFVGDPVELPPSSWGSGKDWQAWNGAQVADLQLNLEVVDTALSTVDKALTQNASVADTARPCRRPDPARDPADGVERLAAHGQQRFRGRLQALPRICMRTPTPREIADALASGRRESRPSAWPTAGTGPTGCSVASTPGVCQMTHHPFPTGVLRCVRVLPADTPHFSAVCAHSPKAEGTQP